MNGADNWWSVVKTLLPPVLMVCAGLALAGRALAPPGMGKVYVKEVRMAPQSATDVRTRFVESRPIDAGALLSIPRSVGLWLSAFFTLAVLSFMVRDNVFYRLSESIFVGVTAGWLMAVGFWDGIVSKLFSRLSPDTMRAWALPDIAAGREPELIYLVPLALGIMLLCRLVPRIGWVAQFPLAVVVGTFAGLRLVNYLDADFVNQIRSSVVPLVVMSSERKIDPWASLRNIGLLTGVLSCLCYFFFSLAHKGLIGKAARVGVWFLMVTFGASFAFTVMGRIALLAARLEFLFDDWLWLIDPTSKRG